LQAPESNRGDRPYESQLGASRACTAPRVTKGENRHYLGAGQASSPLDHTTQITIEMVEESKRSK
jgi:hypothetical protein